MASPIELYVFQLNPGPVAVARLGGILCDVERARAQRFVAVGAKERFVVARATLRLVLAGAMGIEPGDIQFSYGFNGKPALSAANGTLFFNLSHSGQLGAIVVSRVCDVGVDIEVWRNVRAGLAERFFSSCEVDALARLGEPQRGAAFFRCWTRKEAVIKASGEGFSRPLKSFDVSVDDVLRPKLLRIEGVGERVDDWTLFDISQGPGMSGAVACRNRGVDVELVRCDVPY